MTASDVEALLDACEISRLARTRATALALAVQNNPYPLLQALELHGYVAEANQVREALAGRLTFRDEEADRLYWLLHQELLGVLQGEASWIVFELYQRHAALRGAIDMAVEFMPLHRAALHSWHARAAIDSMISKTN